MFRALFARLTGQPKRGQGLFGLAVEEARQTHWFVDGEVPDTVNGRFAVLATIVALITVRLERNGEDGRQGRVGAPVVEGVESDVAVLDEHRVAGHR